MAISSIPISGLVHTVTINRYGQIDDGLGGIKKNTGSVVIIYKGRTCRITNLSPKAAEELGVVGYDAAKDWMILLRYSPNIQDNDMVTVAAGTPAAAGEYRIKWHKHQIDHVGAFHHTSVVMELE